MRHLLKDNRLHLHDDDGFHHGFTALWLREASDDPAWRDPRTGHKLGDGDLLPIDLRITAATEEDGGLAVEFSDGHHARFGYPDLRGAAEDPLLHDLAGTKHLWNVSTLDGLPWHELDRLQADPAELLAVLDDVSRLGFALVRGIPSDLDGMQALIDQIGFMRVTNNGAIEDIKALPPEQAYDLSMTPRALEPHTDNPYRIPQPGYVLLHCLANDAEGGESGMTDGFHIAETIRREHPELFRALTSVPVNWRYADEQAVLEDSSPFIEVAADGSISHVRFHGRSDRIPALDPDLIDTFFEARRLYSRLISDDANQLRFKLQPGEMFIIDNFRMIHSRTAFTLATGSRHMRQAYLDRDVVASRQKTLMRDLTSTPWRHRA